MGNKIPSRNTKHVRGHSPRRERAKVVWSVTGVAENKYGTIGADREHSTLVFQQHRRLGRDLAGKGGVGFRGSVGLVQVWPAVFAAGAHRIVKRANHREPRDDPGRHIIEFGCVTFECGQVKKVVPRLVHIEPSVLEPLIMDSPPVTRDKAGKIKPSLERNVERGVLSTRVRPVDTIVTAPAQSPKNKVAYNTIRTPNDRKFRAPALQADLSDMLTLPMLRQPRSRPETAPYRPVGMLAPPRSTRHYHGWSPGYLTQSASRLP